MLHRPPRSVSRLILLPALLALWPGCVTGPISPPEEARESRHFSTFESGFNISARDGIVRYMVKLQLREPREAPLFLHVRFENPDDPTRPHLDTVEVEPGEAFVSFESPPLRSLEAGRYYEIEIEVFLDRALTQASDIHDILILSTIDTKSHGR